MSSNARLVAMGVTGAVLAALAGAAGCARLGIGGIKTSSEDRSEIIVRSGSVDIIDGRPQRKHDWTGNGREWKQNHRNGADIKFYTVVVQGANTPNCPSSLPVAATTVTFDYLLDNHTTNHIRIGITSSGRAEPIVTSDEDLTQDSNDKALLSYAKPGHLTQVTMDFSGQSVPCQFDSGAHAEIALLPVR